MMKRPLKARRVAQPKKIPIPKNVVEEFFTCPKGHLLPHRVAGKGRCAPFDCCQAKGQAWEVVRRAEKEALQETSAYAEETARIVTSKERMRAWNDAHPVPELPAPPKGTHSVAEYMKRRFEQIAPLALEMKVRKMMLDPDHGGMHQAEDLLDRAGHGRNPMPTVPLQGPILILNFDAKRDSPYETQKRDLPAETSVATTVDAEYEEVVPNGGPSGTDKAVE